MNQLTKTIFKRLVLLGCVAGAFGVSGVAWGQPAGDGRGGDGQMDGARRGFRGMETLSAEERDQALAWAKTAMPKTFSFYEEYKDAGRLRAHVRGIIMGYYRRSKSAKATAEYPDLAAMFDRECKDMDAFIMTTREYSHAPDADRERLRSRMRSQLQSIVVARLKERRARIENLRNRLAQQEQALKLEEARVEQTVDSQFEDLMRRVDMVPAPGTVSSATTQPGSDAEDKDDEKEAEGKATQPATPAAPTVP